MVKHEVRQKCAVTPHDGRSRRRGTGMSYDTIIRNGRWFDGTGAPSAVRNIGISGGHVTAVSAEDLDEAGCRNVIDASGKWVVPGFLDIHTHYDIEVLEGP